MIGKAAIFLKHRAGKLGSKVGGMFRGRDLKNKATIAKFKVKKVGSKVGSRAKKIVTDEIADIKRSPGLNALAYGGGAVSGLGLGAGINYLFNNTNKKGMNKEIKKIQQEKRLGKKNTTKDLTNRLARSQRY